MDWVIVMTVGAIQRRINSRMAPIVQLIMFYVSYASPIFRNCLRGVHYTQVWCGIDGFSAMIRKLCAEHISWAYIHRAVQDAGDESDIYGHTVLLI